MSEEVPKVEPIDTPEYKYKNSKFDMMPKLPARILCVASSTGGRTVLIQNLILKSTEDPLREYTSSRPMFMLMTLGRQ